MKRLKMQGGVVLTRASALRRTGRKIREGVIRDPDEGRRTIERVAEKVERKRGIPRHVTRNVLDAYFEERALDPVERDPVERKPETRSRWWSGLMARLRRG